MVDQTARFAWITSEVVQLLLPVLRRSDELEQRRVAAIEHCVTVWHEVGLVVRETPPRRREQRLSFPRGGNRQPEPIEDRWRDIHLHAEEQIRVADRGH